MSLIGWVPTIPFSPQNHVLSKRSSVHHEKNDNSLDVGSEVPCSQAMTVRDAIFCPSHDRQFLGIVQQMRPKDPEQPREVLVYFSFTPPGRPTTWTLFEWIPFCFDPFPKTHPVLLGGPCGPLAAPNTFDPHI